jgi:hypothetical protein
MAKGDIDAAKLTAAQRDAAAGLYAASMAGFLRWLAPRYAALRAGWRQAHAELRERALAEGGGQHARTPGIVADLALGLKHFLDFAVNVGAVTAAERDDLTRRCWAALVEAAGAQAKHVEAAEPTAQFLSLLRAALASGRAHVAGPDGGKPDNPAAWGWRETEFRTHDGTESRWVSQGRRVGWLDGDDLLLEPEAAYAEAQELARHQGEALPVGSRTLWKRMRERHLLAGWDERRQRNSVRRTLEGVRDREVLHLRSNVLSPSPEPSEPSEPSAKAADPSISPEMRTISADGNGGSGENRPQEPSAKPEETPACGRFGRSDTGGDGNGTENTTPGRKRRRGAL